MKTKHLYKHTFDLGVGSIPHSASNILVYQADFDTGDLVVLGEVPGSASGAAAVVCEMTPLDCRVAVLNPSRSSKVAETPSCTGRGADAAEVAGG